MPNQTKRKDATEPASETILADLAAANAVELTLTPQQAWAVLGQLQLAARVNDGLSAHIARGVADSIQEKVAQTPTLRTVAEQGWDFASPFVAGLEP